MRDGIEVYKLRKIADGQEEKDVLGKSAKAGQMAVMQSAASRVATNVSVLLASREAVNSLIRPILILPPLLMTLLERQGAFAGPRGKTISMLSQLTISMSPDPRRADEISRSFSRCLLATCHCVLPSKGRHQTRATRTRIPCRVRSRARLLQQRIVVPAVRFAEGLTVC